MKCYSSTVKLFSVFFIASWKFVIGNFSLGCVCLDKFNLMAQFLVVVVAVQNRSLFRPHSRS